MAGKRDPLRETDDAARALARDLIRTARTAALAVSHPDTGAPYVSLIAFGLTGAGPATLLSDLSLHTRALRADPRACLLVGGPGDRGDPLNHPRISVDVTADFIPSGDPRRAGMRSDWLAHHPKAKLYVDFADFSFVRFAILGATMNGGFGQAYSLQSEDIALL